MRNLETNASFIVASAGPNMVPVTGLRNTCTLDSEVKDEMERKHGQQRLRSCQAAEAGVALWLPVFGDFGVGGVSRQSFSALQSWLPWDSLCRLV